MRSGSGVEALMSICGVGLGCTAGLLRRPPLLHLLCQLACETTSTMLSLDAPGEKGHLVRAVAMVVHLFDCSPLSPPVFDPLFTISLSNTGSQVWNFFVRQR